MTARPYLVAAGLLTVTLFSAQAAHAQIRVGPGDDLEARLVGLSPGDEVILEDGLYVVDERFAFSATGTAAMPIVVRADDGANPHVRQDANQNIWDIQAEHVVIRGIEFSGGSAGLRFESGANVTVEDCEIHGTSDVALRFNDTGQLYDNIQILRNHIYETSGTGEGMYLGCNGDGCQFANSLVQGNYVHDMSGSQGDGIELKPGSYNNVISDNVIHDSHTGYPCLTLYGTRGNGDANVVEGNLIFACGSHGIQVTSEAVVRNNIILFGADNGALSIQPHDGFDPLDLTVVHNTILANGGDAIALRGLSGRALIANNALYAQSGRALFVRDTHPMLTVEGNVGEGSSGSFGTGLSDGARSADMVSANFSGTVPNDVFPTSAGALAGAGVGAHVPSVDFNGTDRGGVADVGAYAFGSGSNPGWTLAEGFKEAATPPPPTDGGPGDIDAGSPGTDAGGPVGDGGGPLGTDAGPGIDAGMPRVDGGTGTEDGGCSCRATASRRSGLVGLPLVALLGLVLYRRRR
ncbi:MAG: nitrous oxide reductase family maturation protein NosD [Sandaracinaceae bacterium]